MDSTRDGETTWPVDVRTLSPHRGYLVSSLAPIVPDASGTPRGFAYRQTLFDAAKVQRLLEDVSRRISARRGRFDLKRFANPLRSSDERWRNARRIEDLVGSDEFADHIFDRLSEYDRLRHREPQLVDLLGQPSEGLTQVVLAVLEELEAPYAPAWARMQLECLPSSGRLARDHEPDAAFPPRSDHDAFTYLYRIYDIEHAVEILPEHLVRAFLDEVIRRGLANGIPLDELMENNRPTIFTIAAAAEALARNLMNLGEAISFLKKRVALKRTRFVEQTLARDTSLEPGAVLDIRKHYCELANVEHEFDQEELAEIALQWRIHSNNPRRIAHILYGLSLTRPRTNAPARDPGLVRYGPLSVPKRELGR